jgi:hypothetical protein
MNSDGDVSSDEAVSQFLAFTGSSDPSQATSYLEMSGNNLETAVGLYLEHHGGGGASLNPSNGSSSAGGIGGSAGDLAGGGGDMGAGMMGDADVRAPDQTRTMRLMDFDDDIPGNSMEGLLRHPMLGPHAASMMGMGMGISGGAEGIGGRDGYDENVIPQMGAFMADPDTGNFRDVINRAVDAEGDATATTQPSEAATNGNTNSANDNSRYNQTLNKMFAPPLGLIHSAGGFQGARNVAKDSRRWLLVNLQSDSNFSCHALNRDVWRDELVENLVREGFIFWQSLDTSPDGQTYAQRYSVTDFPHVGIIDPRTARLVYRKEGWTQENPMDATEFAQLAADFCSRHSFDRPPAAPRSAAASGATGAGVGPTVQQNVEQMTEEQQLQAAIRASMNHASTDDDDDDDDVIEVYSANGDMDDDEDDDIMSQNENGNAKDDSVSMDLSEDNKKEITFHDEIISMEVGEEPSGTDGVARIMIRMPDGKRLVRKFRLENTVKTVYGFVAQSNGDASGGKEFELKAFFPPKNLMSLVDESIQSAGLAGDTVTVRWKED